jgi:hypothetical protein
LQDGSKLFVEVAGRAGDVNSSGNSAFPILYSFHNASCFIAFGTFNALGSVHHLGTIGGFGYFRHGVISSSTGFAAGTQFFSNLVPAWNAFGGTNRRALLVSMLHDPVRQAQIECRAYGAQIILGIDPQPFRAGLTLGGAASGPREQMRFRFSHAETNEAL